MSEYSAMTISEQTNNNARFEAIERKLDKYDEIIADLRTIVISLKAKSDTNTRWVATMLTIGATIVGGVAGAVFTHLIH